jgi:hypothetical protein
VSLINIFIKSTLSTSWSLVDSSQYRHFDVTLWKLHIVLAWGKKGSFSLVLEPETAANQANGQRGLPEVVQESKRSFEPHFFAGGGGEFW